MGERSAVKKELFQLIADADLNFPKIGLLYKVWTISGNPPSEKASFDGVTVNVGGSNWFSEVDAIETKVSLHLFSKKRYGRHPLDTKFFDGNIMRFHSEEIIQEACNN